MYSVFSLRQVKGDIFSLIDVPVRHQQWSGWPDAAKDESVSGKHMAIFDILKLAL